MIDLGGRLREAREEQGISFSEAETATRIRERYLKALEANDWATLPTHVQTRGFLRNYAIYLGLDEHEIMSMYGQATRSAVVSLPPPPAKDSPVPTTGEDGAVFRPRDIDIDRISVMPSWVNSDVLIGIALALVVALLGFGLLRLVNNNADETSAVSTVAPGLIPVQTGAPPQATLRADVEPGEATLVPVTPTFDVSMGSVQLRLEATEHVWVRVTVDGAPMLEGILAPETVQSWQGTQQILLETPNAAGLRAEVNGQPQGQLGERGETIVLAWGPNGLLPPTPTAAP